jgi:small subunit ribosomal protein S4
MAKKPKSKHKTSRRFGIDLYGIGGPSLERRLHVPPGGRRKRPRPSEYGQQLEEKQKLKAIYGLSEKQLLRYYREAQRPGGNPADNLFQLIERRLDNVIYRFGFARSRPMARQLVSQGHVRVNERRTDRGSYLVRAGDKIELSKTALSIPTVVEELQQGYDTPSWLKRDGTTGQVLAMPAAEDVQARIDATKIIAFYSR